MRACGAAAATGPWVTPQLRSEVCQSHTGAERLGTGVGGGVRSLGVGTERMRVRPAILAGQANSAL